MQFCNSRIRNHWSRGEFCLLLIDTELEKSIGLGTEYPFGKLDAGECIVSPIFENNGYSVGDTVRVYVWLTQLIRAQAEYYNQNVRAPDESEVWTDHGFERWMNCTIAGFIEEPYGKVPTEDWNRLIIMELNEFYQSTEFVDSFPTWLPKFPDFVDYLTQTENILEQYTSLIMVMLPSPRYSYYENAYFHDTVRAIQNYMNDFITSVGTYPLY